MFTWDSISLAPNVHTTNHYNQIMRASDPFTQNHCKTDWGKLKCHYFAGLTAHATTRNNTSDRQRESRQPYPDIHVVAPINVPQMDSFISTSDTVVHESIDTEITLSSTRYLQYCLPKSLDDKSWGRVQISQPVLWNHTSCCLFVVFNVLFLFLKNC